VIRTEQLAVVRGWDDTRTTLRAWRRRPVATVLPWPAGGLVVALLLLLATWIVATNVAPDPLNFAPHGAR